MGDPVPKVSVVVPTLNSAWSLGACLGSIVRQSVVPELIVVDAGSTDNSVAIAEEFNAKVITFRPDKVEAGYFGATAQRNIGAQVAVGQYIYYVDADMVLPESLLERCLDIITELDADAVIIREHSFGNGYWAKLKGLERECYSGNDLVESPRFISANVWNSLSGLDINIGGGGDDMDMTIRLRQANYRIVRMDMTVEHNEGMLTLRRLVSKRYMYAREVRKFANKHGYRTMIRQYNPFRRGYGTLLVRLWNRPHLAVGFVIMRSAEYGAGLTGMFVEVWNSWRRQ